MNIGTRIPQILRITRMNNNTLPLNTLKTLNKDFFNISLSVPSVSSVVNKVLGLIREIRPIRVIRVQGFSLRSLRPLRFNKVLGFIYILIFLCGFAVFTGPGCTAEPEEEYSQYASLPPQAADGRTPVSDRGLPDAKISLDFRDIEIIDALKFLAQEAGMNIIPTKNVSGRVSLMVENTVVRDVFDIILRSNNLAYDKKGDIYNVMTEDEYKALYGKRFFDIRQVKIVRLKYMVPEQAYTFLDTLRSDIGKVLLDEGSGTLLIMDTGERIREIEAALKEMEEKSAVQIFDLKYALAKNIEEQLKKQLDVKKVGTIRADERTNQVIVQTLPERMDEIAGLINGLDKKTKEVLIDARILQIKLSDSLSAGIQWEGLFNISQRYGLTYLGSYPFSSVSAASDSWRSRKKVSQDVGYVGSYPFSGTTSNYSSGAKKMGLENMHIGVVGKNDFDALLNYLQTLGETRILSNPKLAVVNNQEAKIHVGEKQAYITTTTTQSQSTTTVSEAVTYVDVGIQLFVTPFINDEGYVTVKVKPEISSVLSYLETGSKNKIPIIDTSTAETTVMVKEGVTLIIGGLTKNEEVKQDKQTPVLGRVPIVGELFKSRNPRTTRTELLVMLTPHIVSGDELTTGYQRDFGYRLDKESQGYTPFSEDTGEIAHKLYQDYPVITEVPEEQPQFKPAQEIR